MKTIDQAHEVLDNWFGNGRIGNMIFHRGPGEEVVDAIVERVVKCREMDDATRSAIEAVTDKIDFEGSLTIYRDRFGMADRVKFVRRVE